MFSEVRASGQHSKMTERIKKYTSKVLASGIT
jgi:hypothetical protein